MLEQDELLGLFQSKPFHYLIWEICERISSCPPYQFIPTCPDITLLQRSVLLSYCIPGHPQQQMGGSQPFYREITSRDGNAVPSHRSSLTHNTSNGESGTLTSIWLVSSLRDVGSLPNFSDHSLGRGITHFLFLPGAQWLLNLCLLLAAKLSDPTTSEQVQWKLSKPGVKTRIILAHINTKKCHIEIREFREIIGFSNKLASPLVMFWDSSE